MDGRDVEPVRGCVKVSPGCKRCYETLVDIALAWPMTSERELKEWLADLVSARRIEIVGLAPRERTPKLDGGHGARRVA